MEKTTIAFELTKQDIQLATTAVIEQLMLNPLQTDEHTQREIINYYMGVGMLFDCLRSTF